MDPKDQTPTENSPPVDNIEPPVPGVVEPSAPAPTPVKSRKINKKKLLIIVAVIAAIAGLVAAAYYILYLPNTPENIVKKSFENTLQLEKASGKGAVNYKQNNSEAGVSVSYVAQTDKTKNASSIKAEVTVGQAKIPLEARSVDNSVYLKIDDTSGIATLAKGYLGEESGDLVEQLGKQLNGKWIQFDDSAPNSAGVGSCSSALTAEFSQEDIDQLLSVYDKNSFIDVKNIAGDTIEGRSVKRAELVINEDKAKAFEAGISQLEFFKKLQECGNATDQQNLTGDKNSEESSKITVWVDTAKKEIAKIALEGSDKESTMSFDFTFTADPVDIQKPEGATPVNQILPQLFPALTGAQALQSQFGQ